MFRSLTIIILILCFKQSVFAQKAFEGSFEDCKNEAQKYDKLILIDMYFTGCMPCEEMDRKVFPASKIQEILNSKYIFYKTNIMKEEDGKKLARKYGASGFPTYVILNKNGHAIISESGFFGVDRFAELLHSAIMLNDKEEYLAFDLDLNKIYHRAYSERFIKTGNNYPFSEIRSFLAEQKNQFEETVFLANSATFFPEYDAWTYQNLDTLRRMYGPNLLRNKIGRIADSKSKFFGQENKAEEFITMLNYIKPVYNKKLWTVFLPKYVETYYKENQHLETYYELIKKLNVYSSWETLSNAYGNIITNPAVETALLEKILVEYENLIGAGQQIHETDRFKIATLYYKLGKFDKANEWLEKFKQSESKLITDATLKEFAEAITAKNNKSYLPKNLIRLLPMLME
ncbi:thioredoxin family protein [Sphingobacterium bovistauri]|uniref:Thioredoxin fold domain-containing protein n=1 Tax=Sphingobacterium bovistauri TaxID=2781959 RepID=A0ABS7Z622_9SPHI|nr:thioredoxin fold domain-containing protein [Sphingobacterium bovistauri]MCA5005640.1 thioredoxin fold domain-containing protein [Sphingobacterium bovistauri]